MKIWMIWASLDEDGTNLTLIDAWDDDSTSGNREGWLKAVKDAQTTYGGQNIRIASTEVKLNPVILSFQPVKI